MRFIKNFLRRFFSTPDREQWLYNNQSAFESVKTGLEQVINGDLHVVKGFLPRDTKFVAICPCCKDILETDILTIDNGVLHFRGDILKEYGDTTDLPATTTNWTPKGLN